MKISDSRKITLTIDQIRKLIKESEDGIPPSPSPVDGMSKSKVRKTIMRLYQKYSGNHGQMYRDDAWQAVHKIFNELQSCGLNLSYGTRRGDYGDKTGYYRNDQGHIAGKEWEWTVTFIDDKDREAEVNGCLIASFSGTQEQMDSDYIGPDRPYDIIFYPY